MGAFSLSSGISFIDAIAGDILDGLYSVIGSVAGQIDNAIGDLWGGLSAVFSWLGSIWNALKSWIENSLHWLMHTLLPDLLKWVNEIRAKLTQWLQPLIKLIKFEKAWMDQVYNQMLKPMLQLMQKLRSFLVIFRLMGFKWATNLDQWLATMEGKLTKAFLDARGDIQTLANWVNWILDPTGLFNAPLMLLSSLQTLPQLWAVLANLPSVAIGAATEQTQATTAASGTLANATKEVNGRATGATSADLTRYTQVAALYQSDGYAGG